ncbi:MAG: endonuclease [Gemmataceae bacterium]|nr:endonuclease [Gemmataceae bacterium]
MRPVFRDASPLAGDYEEYRDSFPDLVGRIGAYCSYCERRIATNLAVEHIQPKSLPAYTHLKGRWDNFLLGCVNCNSTKKDKDVVLDKVLLPDRDNTAAVFDYTMDGTISVRVGLPDATRAMAAAVLALVGLDRRASAVIDNNGRLVAIDRVAQRMEAWLTAQSSRDDLLANPTEAFRRQVARTARECGFFSIWMAAFADDIAVRRLLIAEFGGTAADCFDPATSFPISPRPLNGLANGGKV